MLDLNAASQVTDACDPHHRKLLAMIDTLWMLTAVPLTIDLEIGTETNDERAACE
jgi:hypothetical protein